MAPTNNSRVATDDLPVLKGDEARDIDLKVMDELGRVRVLECVATRIADTIQYHLYIPITSQLLFAAGKGNNGANAIAAARILYLRGYGNIRVRLISLLPTTDESQQTLRPNIYEQVALFCHFVGSSRLVDEDWEDIIEYHNRSDGGLLIDGVLVTGIDRPPNGAALVAIQAINQAKNGILSIDMPSGLNHITGETPGECVRASWTLNLHMLKAVGG